jgi:hypothetical protein
MNTYTGKHDNTEGERFSHAQCQRSPGALPLEFHARAWALCGACLLPFDDRYHS